MMTSGDMHDFQSELTDTIQRLTDLKDFLLFMTPEDHMKLEKELWDAYEKVSELRGHVIQIEIYHGIEEE